MIRQAHISLRRASQDRAAPRSAARAVWAAALLSSFLAVAALPAHAQDGAPTRRTNPNPAPGAAKPSPSAAKPAASNAKPAAPSAKPAVSGAKPAASGAKPASSTAKPAAAAAPAASAAKPALVATIGNWGVYATAAGRERTCYALAQPTTRAPATLKRDPAYLFLSSRPAEDVRNEISIIMGFDVKTDKTPAEASIGTEKFAMAAQGSHLWVRDAADGTPMIDTMRKGATLVVKAASARGNVTTDTYSLSGVTAALARVQKECP
ncbi:MAG: hypothetical protein K2X62_15865 [Beijerinckiaceae bacterium]|nr:hypothetical protein [Beijerinckiaceae bacterium]MDO9442752.1 hypothetical protein [Beijerinckiaceae bacterium]